MPERTGSNCSRGEEVISEAKIWSLYNQATAAQYDGLSFQEARAIIMVLSPEDRLYWYGFRSGWTEWKKLKDCVELVTFSHLGRTNPAYEPPPTPEYAENSDVKQVPSTDSQAQDPALKQTDTLTEYMTEVKVTPPVKKKPGARTSASKKNLNRGGRPQQNSPVKKKARRISPQNNPSSIDLASDPSIVEPVERPFSDYKEDLRQMSKRAKFDMTDMNSKSREEVLESMRRFRRYSLRLHVEVITQSHRFTSFTQDVSLGGLALESEIPDWVAGYCTVIVSTLDLRHRLEFMCSVVENQTEGRFRLEIYPSSDSGELRKWLEESTPAKDESA